MFKFVDQTKKFNSVISFFEEKLKYKNCKYLTIEMCFESYFYGVCYFSDFKKNKSLIKCRLRKHDVYPGSMEFHIRKFNKNTGANTIKKHKLEFRDFKEEIIWLAGHEVFHFLRFSKQIQGKNTEAQANEFGLLCLNEFQRNISTTL